MDIALSGLAAPLALPAFGRGRNARTGPEQQNNTVAEATNRQTSSDAERSGGRILRGEVLSSRSEPVGNTYDNQREFLKGTGFSQPEFRRFSLPAAIQAFRENEALVADQNQPRQVSGIIDEYV